MLRIGMGKGLQSGQFCSIQKETTFELVTLHPASAAFYINKYAGVVELVDAQE